MYELYIRHKYTVIVFYYIKMSDHFLDLMKKSSKIGEEMFQLMEELFPICRSITGNGVRKTLENIKKKVSIEQHEIPTNTKIFDWIVPKEWNITDGYIINMDNGEKIVDFKESNLHVVNYSIPIDKTVTLTELKEHVFTIPELPTTIPYVTSYYSENWGFCMTHKQFKNLKDTMYKVVIKSTLENGYLTYGEFFIQGKSNQEILLSTYICHPSLCNDNLSGIVLATLLAKYLQNFKLKYSIRFLFIPETIGAITWLSKNENKITKIKHGLVLTQLGNRGDFIYKKSRMGDAEIDQTVINVLKKTESKFKVLDFYPWGSDERQYCSPGFNLPVGSLMRSLPYYENTKEYHTSDDNMEFMSKKSLAESFKKYIQILADLEENFKDGTCSDLNKNKKLRNIKDPNEDYYVNLNPKCEPQLGRRGLYNSIGGQYKNKEKETKQALFWVLNLSDEFHTLKNISKISNINLKVIEDMAKLLEKNKLLVKAAELSK